MKDWRPTTKHRVTKKKEKKRIKKPDKYEKHKGKLIRKNQKGAY